MALIDDSECPRLKREQNRDAAAGALVLGGALAAGAGGIALGVAAALAALAAAFVLVAAVKVLP